MSSVPFYRNYMYLCRDAFLLELELERVRSPNVLSVPCRLQLKLLWVFNQGNAVFEVLIPKIKVQ